MDIKKTVFDWGGGGEGGKNQLETYTKFSLMCRGEQRCGEQNVDEGELRRRKLGLRPGKTSRCKGEKRGLRGESEGA